MCRGSIYTGDAFGGKSMVLLLMKIFIPAQYDIRDMTKWSGTPWFLTRALKRNGARVDFLREGFLPNFTLNEESIEIAFSPDHDWSSLRAACAGSEVLLTLGSSLLFAVFPSDKYKVLYTDAPLITMVRYYPEFAGLAQSTVDLIREYEERNLAACNRVLFASAWAREEALEAYPLERGKTAVLPFGANILNEPNEAELRRIISGRSRARCKLLFVGQDPERKRLSLAYEVCLELRKRGIEAELHVVGIDGLPDTRFGGRLTSWGFLRKDRPVEYERYIGLLQDCHFMLLPSRAECYGVVLCEAAAYGMPALAAATGGIPSIIDDEKNGRLFSIEAPAADYAGWIAGLWQKWPRYEIAALTAYEEYCRRLNWDGSSRQLLECLPSGIGLV